MPFAYMVECSDASYYVGSTWDLERRIGEHNEGLGAEYTRRRRPVRLVWSVQLNRIDEAFRVEKQIQGWGRAKRLALIEGRYDDLPGLARTAKPRDPDAAVSTGSTDDKGVVSTSSTDGDSSTDDEGAVSTSSTDGAGSTDGRW
jgi:putative endonuclease